MPIGIRRPTSSPSASSRVTISSMPRSSWRTADSPSCGRKTPWRWPRRNSIRSSGAMPGHPWRWKRSRRGLPPGEPGAVPRGRPGEASGTAGGGPEDRTGQEPREGLAKRIFPDREPGGQLCPLRRYAGGDGDRLQAPGELVRMADLAAQRNFWEWAGRSTASKAERSRESQAADLLANARDQSPCSSERLPVRAEARQIRGRRNGGGAGRGKLPDQHRTLPRTGGDLGQRHRRPDAPDEGQGGSCQCRHGPLDPGRSGQGDG